MYDKRCLDIYEPRIGGRISAFGCHSSGGNQFIGWTTAGQMVTAEEFCIGITENQTISLFYCKENDENQMWSYDEKVKIV